LDSRAPINKLQTNESLLVTNLRLVETHDVLVVGDAAASPHWKRAWDDICAAIACVDWPHGSGKFSIYRNPTNA
jgi:hypothetical protein